jgi:ABC-type multidrug transport system fused ATPase/permease subunit
VFEHGRVVEQGSYDALVAQDGAFARLVATQQAGIESA